MRFPEDANTYEIVIPIIPYICPNVMIPITVIATCIDSPINGFLLFSCPKNFD